jgi:hypothetical protein
MVLSGWNNRKKNLTINFITFAASAIMIMALARRTGMLCHMATRMNSDFAVFILTLSKCLEA